MISARLVLKSRRLIRPCALCFMLALGASPRAFAETITNGGANIFINFNNPLDCNVIFNGQLPAVQNLVLEGLSVDIDVGGFQKHYVLDANGQVAQASDFFELANNDTNTGLTFTMNSIAANLDQLYAPLGLTNTDVSNAAVSMNVSIAFNETTYTATLSGSYYAQAGKAGKAFLGAIKAPKDPFKPVFHFRFVHAKPNPLLAGETTTFKGEVSLTDLTGDVKGHLIFGDGTAGVHAPGKQFQQMLSEGITHSYASEGIYTAHIHIIGDNEIIATRVF
ncbi:MAG TPA: hypothetical protein VKX17_11800, partial [Planctomycetota bacterium]|nr:hypothetical protein [Planctomycetota bacterium]